MLINIKFDSSLLNLSGDIFDFILKLIAIIVVIKIIFIYNEIKSIYKEITTLELEKFKITNIKNSNHSFLSNVVSPTDGLSQNEKFINKIDEIDKEINALRAKIDEILVFTRLFNKS